MTSLTEHLEAPYFAAVMKSSDVASDYPEPADAMIALATRQPGFLGLETAEEADGRLVTVSYWEDQTAVETWIAAGAALIADDATERHIERACEMRITRVGVDSADQAPVTGVHFAEQQRTAA